MATATLEITLPGLTGFTLSLQLYAYQTDTLVHTIALTEATNRLGTYSGTQVSPTPGLYHARCVEGTTVRGEGYVRVADAAVVHTVVGVPDPTLASVIGTPAGASMSADIAAVKAETASIKSSVDALPTLAQILAGGDVDGFTVEETLKLCLAALAGILSGAGGTTITIRSADDAADRIIAIVDAQGNRISLTLNAAG